MVSLPRLMVLFEGSALRFVVNLVDYVVLGFTEIRCKMSLLDERASYNITQTVRRRPIELQVTRYGNQIYMYIYIYCKNGCQD